VQRLVVLPSAMEPAAAHDAMELGATSSAIDANSNSLVAPVIQSRPSAMELLAAMELPSGMEPAAVRDANFGVGSASIHPALLSLIKINLITYLAASMQWIIMLALPSTSELKPTLDVQAHHNI